MTPEHIASRLYHKVRKEARDAGKTEAMAKELAGVAYRESLRVERYHSIRQEARSAGFTDVVARGMARRGSAPVPNTPNLD